MASPMPTQQFMGGWNNSNNGQAMSQPTEYDDSGVQVRSMGLKVLYKFNKEDKFDCLARPSQTYNVQTIPIDDATTIGVVDLRLCIQAVVECSPELPGQECDYTIYAHDYSEPDTPLVGQGMLSWALHSLRHDMSTQQPKMVTGLVTKNKLGLIMGNANREILEVKLKFTETPRAQQQQQSQSQPQPQQQPQQQQQFEGQRPTEGFQAQNRPLERSMTPTSATEWNSFIQSNPQLGQPANFSRVASPALSQGPPGSAHGRRDSFAQASQSQSQPQLAPQPMPLQPTEMQRIAPMPVDQSTMPSAPTPSSRPSSRASNRASRKKPPTGRPRGRPRKKPVEGNTSGYEDGTEGEDGPAKKRAKITKVDKAGSNPFGQEPESLRVAASTAGSLRNFRPIAMNSEGNAGNHLQEMPRAPTPVPNAPFPGRGASKGGLLRETTMNRELSSKQPSPQSQRTRALSPSQEDGRSPDSAAQTPAYSDDSPAEIGSSPPVPRTTSFMQSSPPPSSPMLPPMPQSQLSQDDVLENDEMGDLFGEEPPKPAPIDKAPVLAPAPTRKTTQRIGPRRSSSTIPMQVFRMEDGPDGQDMVHLCSYNTPDPTSAAGSSDQASKPPKRLRTLKPQPPPQSTSQKPTQFPSPPALAPTPPQTTDAVEKPTSPAKPQGPQPENVATHPITAEPQPPMPQPPTEQAYFAPLPENSTETIFPPTEANEPGKDPNGQAGLPTTSANKAETAVEKQVSSADDQAVTNQQKPKPQSKPRKLARSQSAGPLALPSVPASEPAGPSSLSRSTTAVSHDPPTADAPANLRRAASSGPLNVPVPASDPVGPTSAPSVPILALPELVCPPSDALPANPSSPPGERSNKNFVKKHAIKQRLEMAILNGEMPPFCSNCGAIETPTWRKIWVQEHEGAPEDFEDLSAKPGKVTAVEILKRDSADKPTKHRLVKKSLGAEEDRNDWLEHLLCNPCGIWLVKCNSHRPKDRWEKDASRLGQERRKRTADAPNNSRAKKPRTKNHAQMNPTSEAYLPTDAPGPAEPSSPKQGGNDAPLMERPNTQSGSIKSIETDSNSLQQIPKSTHSNGNGSVKSPIDVEFDAAMGGTKRLLFPSPRKDGTPKVLGEVDVNIVQTNTECRQPKDLTSEKENFTTLHDGAPTGDDLESLFRSPVPPRPSTPPPNAKAGPPSTPFKTPTSSTPNHRPITRSVSRSMRSKRSAPTPAEHSKTPTRTPGRSARRSPRHTHAIDFDSSFFDTPVSRAVNQMLSEPNFGFDDDLDLGHLSAPHDHDWSTFMSTDAPMPSSPPRQRLNFGYDETTVMWEQWSEQPLN